MSEVEITSHNVPSSAPKPKLKLYRLRRGKKHSIFTDTGIRWYTAGQIVELTDSQARAWRDKFEPAPKGITAATPIEKTTVPNPEGGDEPDEEDDDLDEEEGDGEDADDADEPDEGTDVEDQPSEGELPAGDPNESPIARRRREKKERKTRRAR